jgi:hypothetical protein
MTIPENCRRCSFETNVDLKVVKIYIVDRPVKLIETFNSVTWILLKKTRLRPSVRHNQLAFIYMYQVNLSSLKCSNRNSPKGYWQPKPIPKNKCGLAKGATKRSVETKCGNFPKKLEDFRPFKAEHKTKKNSFFSFSFHYNSGFVSPSIIKSVSVCFTSITGWNTLWATAASCSGRGCRPCPTGGPSRPAVSATPAKNPETTL